MLSLDYKNSQKTLITISLLGSEDIYDSPCEQHNNGHDNHYQPAAGQTLCILCAIPQVPDLCFGGVGL